MPHDRNGREIQPGDVVLLRCKVRAVHQTEEACNVDVEAMPPGGDRNQYLPQFTANAGLFEVAPEECK